jgi:hypothetical protein
LLLFCVQILFAQEELKYTDISPDGKSVVSRVNGEFKPLVITTTTAPFGTTPFWTSGLERQIGGLAFGDYDMDGDLDLAAGCYFSQSFPPIPEYNNMIFRNDNGVLTVNPVWFSDDSRSTTDIKWADINNDGKPDLFSGNGDGGYAPSTILSQHRHRRAHYSIIHLHRAGMGRLGLHSTTSMVMGCSILLWEIKETLLIPTNRYFITLIRGRVSLPPRLTLQVT